MQLRTVGSAAAAGLASFLVTFVAVSELLLPDIEFSVLVGIPAGLVVGAIVAAFVLLHSGRETTQTHHRLAWALGTFGVVHLITFLVATAGLRFGAVVSLGGATAVGLIVGVVVYVYSPRR